MGCPKNLRILWGMLRYEGRHRWKRYRIERNHWYWLVEYECGACGARKTEHYAKDEDLIRWGYDIAWLREKLPGDGFGHVLCSDLEPRSPDAPPTDQPPAAEE